MAGNEVHWITVGLIEICSIILDIAKFAEILFVLPSTPQAFPGSWWATGFISLLSVRCRRNKRELMQKRTAWPSLRSVRCATSMSSSPSRNFHALCWWGMEWRNSGGPTEVRLFNLFFCFYLLYCVFRTKIVLELLHYTHANFPE